MEYQDILKSKENLWKQHQPMKHTPGLTHNFSAQLLQYYKDNSPDANKNQQTNDEQFRKCTKCKQITGKVL